MLPHLFVSPRVNLEPNALVIHMRSGDVMRTSRGVKYWQPPLAYYKYIVETFHPTSPIYICTEIHKPADGTRQSFFFLLFLPPSFNVYGRFGCRLPA